MRRFGGLARPAGLTGVAMIVAAGVVVLACPSAPARTSQPQAGSKESLPLAYAKSHGIRADTRRSTIVPAMADDLSERDVQDPTALRAGNPVVYALIPPC